MLQRGIAVIIGGLVTLVLLTIMATGDGVTWNDFVAPLVIGALATFFWPVVIGFWLGRRAKERRENQIQDEVQRQLDQQGR
jgi:Na+/H+ antiporter NhaD/arsenite permease-like protein